MDTRAQTRDGFLGGRLQLRQPAAGFRSGLDAVMVAAAVPAQSGQRVLELGTGAGVAALCLAARVADCSVEGIEKEASLAALALSNAGENAFAGRVSVHTGDVFSLPKALRRDFDHVFANPPFHDAEGPGSPDLLRAAALQDHYRLADWLRIGARRTVSGGTFTAILRADRVGEALAALPQRGIAVFPLWPKAGAEARRVILQVTKGARAPLRFLPGLVLHEADGRYTPEADAILSGGAALLMAR